MAPAPASEGTAGEVDFVGKSVLFSALDEIAAAELRLCMTQIRLGRGDVLFREGQSGDQLYVIAAGRIKLGRTSCDGRTNLLCLLGPGAMFGELSVFDPGPRTATATAVAETTLAALSRSSLEPWLRRRPELSLSMLRRLSRRMRRTTEVAGDLVFQDTPGRVAKVLLDLAATFGQPGPDGLAVPHGLTQEELAQLVGSSRETVNKVLAEFTNRGWLRLAARGVVLLDVERLRRRTH